MSHFPENRADYSPGAAPGPRELRVPAECAGLRLDQVLARLLPQHSRSRLQEWVRVGRVQVDGAAAEPRRRLWGGECLQVEADPAAAQVGDAPEQIALPIVHEDAALIVIDKPAGLVVHPGSGNRSGTMLNALLHHAPELGAVPRAGIVHRLDKDTSGLLVVAKTIEAQTDLARQLHARSVKRCYLAVVEGAVARAGTVDAPIGRHPVQRTRMAVVAQGRQARTHFRVLERFAAATLLECELDTGRTHQIRVHMTHLGHPIVGDPVYGRRRAAAPDFGRQALHACRLRLRHPLDGEEREWSAPLPADMAGLLLALREAPP
jgi:23S rRNA pseudouridine1911/1915/1917 synthase